MKKKIFALILVVVLAATAVIGGTLAYFTDHDEVANTFTLGKVDLDLTEDVTEVPEKGYVGGTPQNDGSGASYTVMPGVKYAKDVNITMKEGSEESYVFVELTVSPLKALADLFPDDKDILSSLLVEPAPAIFTGDHFEGNLYGAKEENNWETYSEIYYCGTFKAKDTFNLFKAVQIPKNIENQNFPNVSFNIKAYAVQKIGINSVKDAYDALPFEEDGFTYVHK